MEPRAVAAVVVFVSLGVSFVLAPVQAETGSPDPRVFGGGDADLPDIPDIPGIPNPGSFPTVRVGDSVCGPRLYCVSVSITSACSSDGSCSWVQGKAMHWNWALLPLKGVLKYSEIGYEETVDTCKWLPTDAFDGTNCKTKGPKVENLDPTWDDCLWVKGFTRDPVGPGYVTTYEKSPNCPS